MAVSWTPDQQRVIDTRKQNILVSAAAGSGKTAVLVERILALVTDGENPADIDELLVVTFTRAAADELRERVRRRLEEAHRERPGDRHLLRQLTLIHNASITTIDSFCMQVVKNHFQEADLDPAFRVGEDGELKLLMQDVMEEILEEAYEEGDRDFLDFADCYASGRNDRELESLIQKLYQFAQSYPWPEEWLNSCRETGDGQELAEADPPGWLGELLESLRESLKAYTARAEMAAEICREADGPYMYEEAVASDRMQLEAMAEADTYARMHEAVCSYKAQRLSVKKDAAVSEVKKETVKGLREGYKRGIENLRKKYFFQELKEMQENMQKSRKAMDCLVRLTLRFTERYGEKKRDKNLVDFPDVEHYALNIFLREEEGRRVRTDAARAYAGKYKEIFIDEYQDSNLVQEILLNSISREEEGEHDLFMVGDVKQSIYSFRLARPELFTEKYYRYEKGEEGCLRIDLRQNFRSRREVLESVNFLFYQVMQRNLGAVAYDEAAALYPGADYPDSGMVSETADGKQQDGQSAAASSACCTEIFLLENRPDAAEEGRTARELEAKVCADRIKGLMREGRVTDKETGELRPVRYSDIVLLLRAMDGWADVCQEVLEQEGIPCRTTLRSGYFTAYEIQTMLNLLRIIDNPRQDIPLAAVMKSAVGGFCEEELARMRGEFMQGSFHEACMRYREEGTDPKLKEKADGFYRMLEHFREMLPYTPIHELIWAVLDETGFEAYAAAMPGGAVRRANLAMLADKAMIFESTSYKGLFHFIRYIDRMIRYQVDYGEAEAGMERPDAVEIQSIHKSKGLEYPIVFVVGMGKGFNEMDVRSKVVLHMENGIGLDYIDPERRIRTPTLKKRAVQRRMRQEMLGEELRVLYVAMTRAKEKLILTGAVRSLEEKLAKWYPETGNPCRELSFEAKFSAGSYLDFVMPALIRNRCCAPLLKGFGLEVPGHPLLFDEDIPVTVHAVTAERMVWEHTGREVMKREELEAWARELQGEAGADVCGSAVPGSAIQSAAGRQEAGDSAKKEAADTLERLRRELDYRYPWKVYDDLPVKLSVSELKKQQHKIEDEEAVSLYEEETVVPLLPRFLVQEQETAGSVRGDAYHRLMEMLDFSVKAEEGAVDGEARRLIAAEKFSEEEYGLVESRDIVTLLESPLGLRMSAAFERGELVREQPFVLGISAEEVREKYAESGEQLLIQGIIDAFFYEEGDIVLLDYKTDRLYTEEAFGSRYRVQLEYYQKALERLTGRRVKEIYIYSFTLGRAIRL